jgi:hypothetical protein
LREQPLIWREAFEADYGHEYTMATTDKLPLLIGIRGAMGAGKDTLAAEIVKRHPEYRVCKFANKLREAASLIAVNVPPQLMATDEEKQRLVSPCETPIHRNFMLFFVRASIQAVLGDAAKIEDAWVDKFMSVLTVPLEFNMVKFIPGLTIGRLLQLLGTECFRDTISPTIWADSVLSPWAAQGKPHTIVADARFPNETKAIREAAGVIIEVRRTNAARNDGRSTRHASERALDGELPDFVIENDGSIDDLGKKFDQLAPGLEAYVTVRSRKTTK